MLACVIEVHLYIEYIFDSIRSDKYCQAKCTQYNIM